MRTATLMVLLLSALTGISVYLTLQNYQRAARNPQLADRGAQPRYTLHDAQWTRLGDDGQPQYVVHAVSVAYLDDQSARLTLPVIDGFGGDGSPWHLTAPAGSTLPHSRNLVLTDNVVIDGRFRDGQPLTITTPYLWVDANERVLHTDAAVVLQSAGRNIRATGLIADADGKQVRLLNQVRGEYAPPS